MEINIISKKQVKEMIDAEIRQSETRLVKIIQKLRERILEIEGKLNLKGLGIRKTRFI